MGSSDSKHVVDIVEIAADVTETDNFLQILNEVTKGKQQSYKDEIEKLTTKRDHIKLAQEEGNGPNKSTLLRLKNEKLKEKITNKQQQHKSELEFSTNIRKIYSELKEKLRNLENEKTIQIANLNLELTNQKSQSKLLETASASKVRSLESVAQSRHLRLIELEALNQNLRTSYNAVSVDLDREKKSKNELMLANQHMQEIHNKKYKELEHEYSQTKLLEAASATRVRSLEAVAQSRQIKIGEQETTIQNLRVWYNTVSTDLEKSRQSKKELMLINQDMQKAHNKEHKEMETKYNREQQINKDMQKEIDEISILLVANVKLTCMQQRGTFLELKKTIEGMQTDLQFLIPNLNDRTIPTAIECGKEMEKLDMQLAKYMDKLQQITAYQGRFEKFIRTKKSLCTLEKTPNFLSAVEIPYSFLHVIFLPLFRSTFTVVEQDEAAIAQRPVNWNNNSRGALRKTSAYTPRANNDGRDDNAESSRNPNANYRGRAGFNKNGQRPPRSRSGPKNNNRNKFKPPAPCVDDDSDNDSVVMLTVLTTGEGASSGATPKTFSAAKRSGTTCILCCELFNTLPVRHLSCAHEFHISCIDEWFESNTECPQCIRDEDDD